MSNLKATEELIVNAINIIRDKNRKRPTTTCIYEELNQNKDNDHPERIDLSEFQDAMLNLQTRDIIYDKGRNGKESYFVREKHNLDNTSSINTSGTVSSLQEFIDDKFFETLNNKIKQEVKNQVSMLINKNNIFDVNSFTTPDDNRNNNEIIALLKSQLEFVKSEIASKDKIIDILLNDKSPIKAECTEKVVNNDTNNESFVLPRKTCKLNYNNKNKDSTINLNNRFNILNTTAVNNCIDAYGNDFNSTFNSNRDIIRQSKSKNRSITIVGDSLVKDVKAFKMKKSVNKGDKLYVKSFPGATTNCMSDYIKPSLRYNPDLVIIHCGSNDLRSQKTPNIIADDIVELASKSKTETNDVVISGLIARNDELNLKAMQVNEQLIAKCNERQIFYIDNNNIIATKHLNGSGLHLNHYGTMLLSNNFLNCIKM